MILIQLHPSIQENEKQELQSIIVDLKGKISEVRTPFQNFLGSSDSRKNRP
ncbi:MAG: hypothetical protein KatS3mg035_0639 [Bacteroidia bacterium]|nr:MAG: hypothetical protein KatS3mg035_0639 [Bacteroidia bacterium]